MRNRGSRGPRGRTLEIRARGDLLAERSTRAGTAQPWRRGRRHHGCLAPMSFRKSPRRMGMEQKNRWIALVVLCVGMLMIVLDGTVVNVALPTIQDDLGFSPSSLAWVVNAYLIAFG